MDKNTKTLQIVLGAAGIYYAIGALAHFFGLTIFPFFVGGLHSPYHDTLIAIAAAIFSATFFVTARDPSCNPTLIHLFIFGSLLAIIGSLWLIFNVDFAALGAADKLLQTKVETGLLLILFLSLLFLKPKKRE